MTQLQLKLTLKSDTTFGRGDGVAGLLDVEVQHDEAGCPYLAGRTLKGLLVEECANLLYALDRAGKVKEWLPTADALFGVPGSTGASRACLTVANAQLPAALRQTLAYDVDHGVLTRDQVLNAVTAIRRQTAVDPVTDAPMPNTLRSMRVILRKTVFLADLTLAEAEDDPSNRRRLGLLAACVMGLRRAGTGRNRGRGEVVATLHEAAGKDVTDTYFTYFRTEVL